MDEGTGVTVLLQAFGEVALFLLQGVLPGGDAPCSVIQALDQSPLGMGWMVRSEVQVSVRVCGLRVDSNIQVAILSPLKQGVEGRPPSFSTSIVNLMDGLTLLRGSRSPSTVPFFTIQQVSSTCLFQSRGFAGADLSASSSKNSMYRLATIAEMGEPIAAPSHCL